MNTHAIDRRSITAFLACAAAALFACQPSYAADKEPVVILISSHGSYRDAANRAAEKLEELGVTCRVVSVEKGDQSALRAELARIAESSPLVVVAGGATLTTEVLKSVESSAVVSMMTPNAADAEYAARSSPHRPRVATVTSDVDPASQIDWIRTTKGNCKRVAVLCSPRTKRTAEAIRHAGTRRGVEIILVDARHDQFPAAIEDLNERDVDGVLMIPDSQVYNAPNVQRLLLWGVRQKRPVWAFSPKVVKAGALAGVYSDPADVGAETARVVKQIVDGASPSTVGLHYINSYGYAVNLHTAEMTNTNFGSGTLNPRVVRYGDD